MLVACGQVDPGSEVFASNVMEEFALVPIRGYRPPREPEDELADEPGADDVAPLERFSSASRVVGAPSYRQQAWHGQRSLRSMQGASLRSLGLVQVALARDSSREYSDGSEIRK